MLFTRDHPVYTPALMRPLARKAPACRKIRHWGAGDDVRNGRSQGSPLQRGGHPSTSGRLWTTWGAARSTTASGAWRTLVR